MNRSLLAALLLYVVSTSALSYTAVTQQAGFETGNSSGPSRQFFFQDFSDASAPVENSLYEPGKLGTISAYAKASPGVLKNSGAISIQSSSDYGTGSYNPDYESPAQLSSTAVWGQYFTPTVSDPSLNGRSATLSFSLYIQGGTSGTFNPLPSVGGSGGVSSYAQIYVGSKQWYEQTSVDGWGTSSRQAYTPDGLTAGIAGIYLVDLPVTIGVTNLVEISLQGSISALARGGSSGSASFDLGHSVYWGGAKYITVDGEKLSDFYLATSDGVNLNKSYLTTSVPEPSSVLLALAGIGAVVARMRARK
jgi:hypothetical protein